MSRFFGKLHRDMNRVNVEGYGLIRIFIEKIRISLTKLWRVCIFFVVGVWGQLLGGSVLCHWQPFCVCWMSYLRLCIQAGYWGSFKQPVILLLSCPSHHFFPLAGACHCPLCHCGQVVSRAKLKWNTNRTGDYSAVSTCLVFLERPHVCAVAEWVRALDWRPGGPAFESRCGNFTSELLAIPFTRFASVFRRRHGPFYLVFMPGEVKDVTSLHWKCVTCRGLHTF